MFSVTKIVRDAVTTILSSDAVGFNTNLIALCEEYKIKPFAIDFTEKSNNFFAGFYSHKDLNATSNLRYPVMCLFTLRSENDNQNKFSPFSGSVEMGISVYLSYGSSSALDDIESLPDAVDAAMYNVFNSEAAMPFYGQAGYNGDLKAFRRPVQTKGSNWMQPLDYSLTFDLTVG